MKLLEDEVPRLEAERARRASQPSGPPLGVRKTAEGCPNLNRRPSPSSSAAVPSFDANYRKIAITPIILPLGDSW